MTTFPVFVRRGYAVGSKLQSMGVPHGHLRAQREMIACEYNAPTIELRAANNIFFGEFENDGPFHTRHTFLSHQSDANNLSLPTWAMALPGFSFSQNLDFSCPRFGSLGKY
jgi:hypothetical protein